MLAGQSVAAQSQLAGHWCSAPASCRCRRPLRVLLQAERRMLAMCSRVGALVTEGLLVGNLGLEAVHFPGLLPWLLERLRPPDYWIHQTYGTAAVEAVAVVAAVVGPAVAAMPAAVGAVDAVAAAAVGVEEADAAWGLPPALRQVEGFRRRRQDRGAGAADGVAAVACDTEVAAEAAEGRA